MRRVVLKLGGSVLVDSSLREQLVAQIGQLRREDYDLILVHGGGKQIASLLDRLRIESHFYDGLRVTDRAARDAAQMVLAGQVGKDLVAELAKVDLTAASIAGGDGLSFLAEKMPAEDGTDLGFVGRIVKTDSRLVEALLAARILPVVACLALGLRDGEYYNINGDQMAAAVAAGCAAETLVFVTDVGGVRGAAGEQLSELDRAGIRELLATGVASGGMRPKLRACLEALEAGVERVLIIGAAEPQSVWRVLQQGEALGTRIS
ncbi:MAG TPA: acetylglutamate kinase [Blastocatellia bacterium]|nr:acetylglutamate kinase [Blastocatellia bacterium]